MPLTKKSLTPLSITLTAALLLGALLPAPARAGAGAIDPADGSMDFEINLRFPPTSAQIETLKNTIRSANTRICDATDGQIRFRNVRLTGGATDEDKAAMWINVEKGRATVGIAPDGSSLGTLGSHINLFIGNLTQADTIAHELSHHAFGLYDEYGEQLRFTLGDSCGIGGCFDAPMDGRNASMMQDMNTTEYCVAANHDPRKGDGLSCPPALAPTGLLVKAKLDRAAPTTAFDPANFSTARNTSALHGEAKLLDSLGGVSPHLVQLYFSRTGAAAWTLRFGLDEGDTGGTAGKLSILQTVNLTFNPDGTLASLDPPDPQLVIQNLANGAADLSLDLDLGAVGSAAGLRESNDPTALTWLEGLGQRPLCVDPNCAQLWNTTTSAFEVTQHSRAQNGLSGWQVLVKNYPFVSPPGGDGRPVEAAPADCGNRLNFIDDVVGSDQVMLVIDRSGSMKAPVQSGATSTRLDFAQAAARAFIDLQATGGAQVGLVSFEETPALDRPLDNLLPADADPFKLIVNGLKPDGMTGIGTALDSSRSEFVRVEAAGRTRTAFLLSDGENNRGTDPRAAAQQLKDMGVRIFTVPVGSAADRSLLSDIAGQSGGVMFDAPTGDELPPIYAELFARFRGEALALPRTESAVGGNPDAGLRGRDRKGRVEVAAFGGSLFQQSQPQLPEQQEFPINVEGGGKKLNVFLSARNLEVKSWNPGFRLLGPNGEVITDASPGVVSDAYYRIARVNTPSPGQWRLQVFSNTGGQQHSFVLAHVENPAPDLYADARPRVAAPGQTVRITASPSFVADLEGPVALTGSVRRPDGSLVPLSFTYDARSGTRTATFNAFAGRGVYEVSVECEVAEGARPRAGESIFDGPERPAVDVKPFVRTAHTAFFLNTTELPPCASADCDGDGIPNATEGEDDIDGDGLPCSRDDDCDGDDVPDALDPEPRRPGTQTVGGSDGRALWFSFHVGHGFPAGSFSRGFEPGPSVTADLEFEFSRRLSFYSMLGYHYFHSKEPGVPNLSYTNLSFNLRGYFPLGSWRGFVQGGPGVYFPNQGSADFGLNFGAGLSFPLQQKLALELGTDLHYVDPGGRRRFFFDPKLGLKFRF